MVLLHPAHTFINSHFNLLSLNDDDLNEPPVPAGLLNDRPFEEVEWCGCKQTGGLGED